jgi:hypothetical protein
VERVVGWFKECRRLGTRYEKLAVNYVAFWMVAKMERDLRLLGFSDRAYSLFHMTLHSFIGPVTLIGVVVFRQDAPYG